MIKDKKIKKPKLLIGYKEWLSLPKLGIHHIKAKIDTGARTSALHARYIKSFIKKGKMYVRFEVDPLQHRPDIWVECEALVIDQRMVSDSSGNREKRFVIKTPIQIGELQYEVEVTLTNREKMSVKMLLGREAMMPLLVDPTLTFVLGKPIKASKAYRKGKI